MGLMVELTCRTCGHPVYIEGEETHGLGKPYVRCSNCKSMVLMGRRSEWQLKSFGSRAVYVLSECAPAMVLPLFLVFAVLGGFWLTAEFTGRINDIALVGIPAAVYAIATAIAMRGALKRVAREISRSRRRMLNADYRHKLKHMGLLK